jgi:hypothetical protein
MNAWKPKTKTKLTASNKLGVAILWRKHTRCVVRLKFFWPQSEDLAQSTRGHQDGCALTVVQL